MADTNYNLVLESTKFLVDSPQYVTINVDSLEASAKRYATIEMKIPTWEGPMFPEDPQQKAVFLLVGNAINFAYSRFEDGTKWESTPGEGLPSMSGAFGMWASLMKAMKSGEEILNPNYLAKINERDVKRIFEGNIEIPMVVERAKNLKLFGYLINSAFDNSITKLMETAEGKLFTLNGSGLVNLLSNNTPAYGDSNSFRNKTAFFDKRVQLAAGMLIGAGLFPNDQVNQLTVFADYNLPNELRHQGVIEYSKNLATRVDDNKMIKAGSREELEIRASTVHAADRIIKRVNELRDDPINALHLDAQLFFDGRGRKKEGTEKFPHHLTQTTAY